MPSHGDQPAEPQGILRKPNWGLFVPLAYAPAFPLLRIYLNKSPHLPAAYGCALALALAHAGYIMACDSST
ncbi:hypothetical protein M885DRAFT_578922 [Pelagophyceae sp. CCMP2097]|nr:hypothetical protein M885DRAFT_578922 [Pelagophyceae sp. CCMP2097]